MEKETTKTETTVVQTEIPAAAPLKVEVTEKETSTKTETSE